jgi:ribosome biogenesis GTPase / thiamine phosphate phosphatase
MAPKYRGDSEDWLDEEGGHSKQAKVPANKKAFVGKSNAVVMEVYPNQCRVRLDEKNTELLCRYRRATLFGHSDKETRERTPVAVGDRVAVSSVLGMIEGVETRKNAIYRLAPGREGKSLCHVLAANIDQIVIVASANSPPFSSGLVDRFLIGAQVENVPAIICINKVDLIASSPAESEAQPWAIYHQLGYKVFEISVKQRMGLDALRPFLEQKTVVFCGHSGVGKTSLLRLLTGSEIGKVAETNVLTGKGRHTTTGAVLIQAHDHTQWIDTPGVREFGLMHIEPQELKGYFPEFITAQCPLSECLHFEEPSCQARSFPRYPSYLRIFKSLLADGN